MTLNYAWWFVCDDALAPPAQDFLDVSYRTDNGANWTLIRHLATAVGWVQESLRLSDYVTPTAQMRVRFSTMDRPNN